MNIGDKIRQLRETNGMTLEELGDKVGVGKSTVRKWETGMIANMRRDKILKVAQALGTTPDYLMGWEKPAEDEAEKLADMVGDRKLTSYIEKISQLDDADKEKIYSYIDYIISSKK